MSTLTAQEIYAQMAQHTITQYLYNPNDKPVFGKYDSRDYTLPPASECYIKVKHGKVIESHDDPGVLPLRSYTYVRMEGGTKEGLTTHYITTESIIEHLVGPDRVSGQIGPKGVRLLTGNPEYDVIIKAEARVAALQKQYEDDVALTNAHEQVCANAVASARMIPALPPRVREAMQRRAKHESGDSQDYAKYICPKCGERCKDEMAARSHVAAYHSTHAGQVLEKLGLKPIEPKSEVPDISDEDLVAGLDPVKRGPGRPRKVE